MGHSHDVSPKVYPLCCLPFPLTTTAVALLPRCCCYCSNPNPATIAPLSLLLPCRHHYPNTTTTALPSLLRHCRCCCIPAVVAAAPMPPPLLCCCCIPAIAFAAPMPPPLPHHPYRCPDATFAAPPCSLALATSLWVGPAGPAWGWP
jgi:hypothetical protein